MYLLVILGCGLALLITVLLVVRHKSNLIFGIYPAKSVFFQLKYYIALLILRRLRYKLYNPKKDKVLVEELEQTKNLSDHPTSYDVVSFTGANTLGQTLLVFLERRRRGILKGCLYLWLPDQGQLCSPNIPDMMYFTTDGTHENLEFRGGGFHIYLLQCMRRWRICYEGPLRKVSSDELVQVKLDLEFSSNGQYFDYNRDLSSTVIADSVAREAWNDEFFSMLRSIEKVLQKRSHYEQVGRIEGHIKIAKNEQLELKMKGFRDHNFGTDRCLSQINRYVYIALFLDDDTSIIVGNISQPTLFLSSLKVGYVCTPQGQYHPITGTNFELYTYGEKGTPPLHQNFFVYTAENEYFVQITVKETAIRYIGGNWESKVFNQFVSCNVNGVLGNGTTEFLYRHKGGRPEDVCANDPEWYQRVRSFESNLSSEECLDDSEEFCF